MSFLHFFFLNTGMRLLLIFYRDSVHPVVGTGLRIVKR
jgi:hypothetical protein